MQSQYLIATPRLDLHLMTEEFLNRSLNQSAVEEDVGFTVSAEWLQEIDFMKIRRGQYREETGYSSWGVRAIVKRDTQQMVGHIGFHSTPNQEYLQPYATEAVEFGYSVYPEFRSQGFATEACQGLVGWAFQNQMQNKFVISISPENTSSLAIASKLGFARIGQWEDPEDGTEWVFLLEGEPLVALVSR